MPASETDLYARLDRLGIAYAVHRHPPLFTVEESRRLRGDLPGGHCKNLFLKDRKDRLFLVVVLEAARVDVNRLDRKLGCARLSFGRPDLLMEVLGVEPGSVTPFGLINDSACRVAPVLDAEMLKHDVLNYHPLRNDATLTLKSADLLAFIRDCGHDPLVLDVTTPD